MKIVLSNGLFDHLNHGHIAHLFAAKALGDILIVAVTADDHAETKPLYLEQDRAALVRALSCVDHVMVVTGLLDALKICRPHILAQGREYQYTGLGEVYAVYCQMHGVEIAFTDTPKE